MASKCPGKEDGLPWLWSLGVPLAMCASHKHLAVLLTPRGSNCSMF